MTDDVFAELDRAVGPVAMMSLQSRGLLPAAGIAGDEPLPERDLLMDRVAGALLGAAIGNALGRLAERKQRQRGAAEFVSTEWLEGKRLDGSNGKVHAGVQQLVISAEALLANGVGAAPVVSDELVRRVRRLRVPGRAIVATVEQRRAGLPWFEAGAGSFGEGALCRAIAAGLGFANDPVRRPVIAALDAAVTHASTQATHARGGRRRRDRVADPWYRPGAPDARSRRDARHGVTRPAGRVDGCRRPCGRGCLSR